MNSRNELWEERDIEKRIPGDMCPAPPLYNYMNESLPVVILGRIATGKKKTKENLIQHDKAETISPA